MSTLLLSIIPIRCFAQLLVRTEDPRPFLSPSSTTTTITRSQTLVPMKTQQEFKNSRRSVKVISLCFLLLEDSINLGLLGKKSYTTSVIWIECINLPYASSQSP